MNKLIKSKNPIALKSFLTATLSLLFMLATFGQQGNPNTTNSIHVYCNEGNDLYQLLKSNGYDCIRYDVIDNALKNCKKNDVLLILAKNYPEKTTVIPSNFYTLVNKKKLKTYIEFPNHLDTEPVGEIKSTKKERLVVTSNFFGKELASMRILDAGLYFYIDVPERESHLKGANVAGFDKAIYGLKKNRELTHSF